MIPIQSELGYKDIFLCVGNEALALSHFREYALHRCTMFPSCIVFDGRLRHGNAGHVISLPASSDIAEEHQRLVRPAHYTTAQQRLQRRRRVEFVFRH